MTAITLALPLALPPADMAPHLLRALQAPALATLLTRHSSLRMHAAPQHSPVLPHEAWLARLLDQAGAPRPTPAGAGALALACMRGCGLGAAAASGHWLIVQPAHIQVSSTHPSLADPRGLQLSDAHARALYEAARPYCEELGKPLLYGRPDLWFLRADDWADLSTASPDAVVNQNLGDWLPEGAHARDYRRLQNEIQMLWYQHPVNAARAERGLGAVNAYWSWGGAGAGGTNGNVGTAAPAGADLGLPLAVYGGPSWMAALTHPAWRASSGSGVAASVADAAGLIAAAGAASGRHAVAVVADLIPAGLAGDWAEWLARLQQIDEQWCAPLLAALKEGRLDRVILVLSHRDGRLDVASTKLAQYQFWRKPSLSALQQP